MRKCITCDGEGKLTEACLHCGEEHTCMCLDCKGTGKLPFDKRMVCEECGKIFSCPLTEGKGCRNSKSRGKEKYRYRESIPTVPYTFVVKNGVLMRQCCCEGCSSLEEWRSCFPSEVEKRRKEEEEYRANIRYKKELFGCQ